VPTRYHEGGDFSLLVVDEITSSKAYLIYTSLQVNHQMSIEELSSDFLSSLAVNDASKSSGIFGDKGCVEAPALFERGAVYYALFGRCCCFCEEGSNLGVYTASTPLGPYTFQGEIGIYPNGSSVTHSQQNFVMKIETKSGVEYVFTGDRWQSAPDHIKAHDFQYWMPLTFDSSSPPKIEKLQWIERFTLNLNRFNPLFSI